MRSLATCFTLCLDIVLVLLLVTIVNAEAPRGGTGINTDNFNNVDLDKESEFEPDDLLFDAAVHETAKQYAQEFRAGNYDNVLRLVGAAHWLRDVYFNPTGLTDNELEDLHREARRQALPEARKIWRRLQRPEANSLTASHLWLSLHIYGVTPKDLGTTQETIDEFIRKAHVNEARQRLSRYEKRRDALSLSSFFVKVDAHSISAEDLGITQEQLQSIRHREDVQQAKCALHLWESTKSKLFQEDVEAFLAKGVTLKEIGLTRKQFKKLQKNTASQ